MIKRSGFTLVEIIVVIAVLAILATLTTLGVNQFLKGGRDANRQSNVSSLSEALEKYYDTHGEYPSCAEMTAPADTIVNTTLKGLDPSALVTPGAPSGTTNSIQCTDLASSNGTDYIAYVGDGSSSCATASCLQYTLKYINESDNKVATVDSRRKTNINTSGLVALTADSIGYTSTTVNWQNIPNTTSYTLQRDTTDAFNSGNLRSYPLAAGTTTYQSTDLAPNVTYYYRAQTQGSTGLSAWSEIVSQKTDALPVPSVNGVQNNPSTIQTNWNAGTNITSYTIQRGSSAAFGAGTFDQDIGNFTSKTYADTPIGTARHYRVRTNVTNSANVTYNSGWSLVYSYTSFVPAPTAPSISAALSGTNATGTSGTVTCTQGGVPQYALRETRKTNAGNADNWSAWTSWSPSVRTYTVGALQGHEHKFQSNAACLFSGVYSASVASGSTGNVVRGIDAPARPTWPTGLTKTWRHAEYGHYMWYNTFCPAGTWTNETWFHSWGWQGQQPIGDFYHNFGFNDYWLLGPSGGAGVEYNARYTCASSFTSSGWSPESYDAIWVTN